ncbi:hypothetical protein EDB89DRAFT_2064330 [Lactarius sanguifluus]|nr:hypothetical protein EDB89DRAFT_2064330 [Lactarius sanguifluus]
MEDVKAQQAPPASSVDAVHEWQDSYGAQKEEFYMWKHAKDGDGLVHPSQYSPPPHLDKHIELIQPTTVFNRTKAQCTTYNFTDLDSDTAASSQSSSAKITVPGSGVIVTVDASCNKSITVSFLKQLYNAVT